MKFGTLKSIAHNIADSMASGIGMMIGVYEIYVWQEAAASEEGYIEVDFLTGETKGGKPSAETERAVGLYVEKLPELCRSHGAEITDFRQLSARFSGGQVSEGFTVTIEDKKGRSSTDHYLRSGKRPRVLDHLGRVRRT